MSDPKPVGIPLLLLTALLLLSLFSCKPREQECYQSVVVVNTNYFSARYHDTVSTRIDSTHSEIDTVVKFRDTTLRAPEIRIIDPDTSYPPFISPGQAYIGFRLDPAKDSMRVSFRTDSTSGIYDTLTYFYKPVTHFINNGCGYTFYYNLESVKLNTSHMLDSVAIITPKVSDNTTEKNVYLYFKLNP